jgi:TPR repeat protein
LLREAADKHVIRAILELVDEYTASKEFDLAREFALWGAHRSERNCQCRLANLYYSGQGGPRDLNEAARWYRRAHENGVNEASADYAVMLIMGKGFPKNPTLGAHLLKQAARQNAPGALFNLGELSLSGNAVDGGIPQDASAAREYFAKATEAGQDHPIALRAQVRLARCLSGGLGGPQDVPRARALLQEVADREITQKDPMGVGLARFNLARAFEGDGNLVKAYEYFKKTAEAGLNQGVVKYARLTLDGGIPVDVNAAKQLVRITLENPSEPLTVQTSSELSNLQARLGK